MPDSETESEDSLLGGSDMFTEGPDYFPPSPKATTETIVLNMKGLNPGQVDGDHDPSQTRTLSVRLVGHNPLWGHHLWNAGRVISNYLLANPSLVKDKTVLELGAGAGLPSLVSAILHAKAVVVTDYPDPDLVQNLWFNIENAGLSTREAVSSAGEVKRIVAQGYTWGAEPTPLFEPVKKLSLDNPSRNMEKRGFDLLILADLLFNHSEHAKLVSTVQQTMTMSKEAKALVFFTPYRPWLLEKDLAFFDLIREAGLEVNKVLEEKMEKVMFEEDRGDEELRRTVFGYIVTRNTDAVDRALKESCFCVWPTSQSHIKECAVCT